MSSPRSPRFISTCRSQHLKEGLKLSADWHARAMTLFAKRAPNVVGVSPANARRLSPRLRQTTSPTLTADSAGNGETQHTSRSLDVDDARLDGDGDTLRDLERALVVNRHRHRARHKRRIWRNVNQSTPRGTNAAALPSEPKHERGYRFGSPCICAVENPQTNFMKREN